MSHNMFKHILALNTYTEPFLSMRAGDQREIIEQLLGITLLSEKAEILSKEIKQTKELIFQENANIEAMKKSNEKALKAITIITDKLHKYLKSQGIDEIQTHTYDEDLHEVVSMMETGTSKVVDVVSKGYTMNGVVVKYPKIIISR